MFELKGKYNTAKVFAQTIEEKAAGQVIELCNQEFVRGAKVRIMPDVHAGKGCVIGFTADLGEKVIPNVVGVDIGCGILCVKLGDVKINLEELDDIVNKYIPAGFRVHSQRKYQFPKLKELYCYRELSDTKRIIRSIGTLGGGNHFIEVNVDEENHKYLAIHTGSRNLGKQVADHYQRLAIELCSGKSEFYEKKDELIKKYKRKGRRKEISSALRRLKRDYQGIEPDIPRHLCYLEGKYRSWYLNDMQICQEYASLNRKTIANIILTQVFSASLDDFEYFETIHNYINFADNIIRKGSVSAYKGEELIIPVNMRDGSIIALGKGNPDWNYSAPHGAGRIMSRTAAKKALNLEEFENSMQGIYTTSVGKSTLDEAPMAYKPIDELLDSITEAVEIKAIIKPIYNFKAK